MERKDVTPSDRAQARAPGFTAAPAALFDCGADLDALERTLLALATHPHGAGAARAWLLRANPRRGLLEGWRHAAAPLAGEALEASLARARRAAPGESSDDRRARAWSAAPEALTGAPSAAWRGAAHALAAGGDDAGAPWADARRVVFVRVQRGTRVFGVFALEPAADLDDATAGARAEALGTLASAALGAQARAAEARDRARQAAALAEFARACVSSINLAEGLHLLARLAAQGVAARGAAVFRSPAPGAEPRAEVTHGPAAVRDRVAEGFAAAAARVQEQGTLRTAERGEDEPGLPADVAGETSAWALLPLAAYERPHGVLLVHDGPDRDAVQPGFETWDVEFLAALAAQAGLLLAHAQGLAEARRTSQREREQGARLRELDRLASVGELAARVAQEARNPLASIAAFARRAHRALEEGDPQREYLDIIVRESARLEAMLGEQLQYSQLERPRLRMQALNGVVQEALQRASETLVRRRVRLLKKLAPDLPQLLLDAPRIQRVVENVLAYALESVSMGGRIQVETRRAGAFVLVEVAFDGQRQAGELLEQLFVPFATSTAGGAAVGLGMAQQIVREHGGEVRVRGESDWSTVFAFTLPVAGNEDRRRNRDRRSVRGERRRRDSDAGGGAV